MWITVLFAVVLPAMAAWLAAARLGLPAERPGWSSFSGGMLVGAVSLVVLPEVWPEPGAFVLGFLAVAVVDRFIHPLCADCGGEHSAWSALPLWLALGTHSLLDGALIEMARPGSFTAWILLAHRVPEALAMLALVRTARPRAKHLGPGMAALQLCVLAGMLLAAELNRAMLQQSYAMAGGAVLFLALHRLHRSWRESRFSLASSVGGAASVWMVRLGLDLAGRH
jgi:hypothetical protein